MPSRREQASRILAGVICALVVGALLYVVPARPRNALLQAATWGVLMLLSFLGWGSLAHAALAGSARADPGLRMVWGASLVAALAALLGAGSAFSAVAATGLVALGAVMCAVLACAQRHAIATGARVIVRLVRRSPLLAAVGVPIAALMVLAFVGAASDWTRNPYDDDIAYIPFAKKLLDTGTLIEPFSHRRLTAYGGQTFFQAILSTRARFDQFNLFDRGVALAMTAVLVTFHRAGGKRARVEVTFLVLALLYVLPSVSINGASYYSGLAFFFGMYRTLEWQGEGGRVTARGAALTGLVAAATCSLRMNYIPVVAVLLAASYVPHARRRWSSSVRELLWLGGAGALALAPWLALAWRSGRTFLYPLVLGVGNGDLTLRDPSASGWVELRHILRCAVESEPVHTLPLFGLAAVLLPATSARQPLRALWLASAAGFLTLAHQVAQADPWNLARYSFGYLAALVLATALTAGTAISTSPGRVVAPALALVALLAELTGARAQLSRTYERLLEATAVRLRNAPESPRSQPHEAGRYARAQAKVPPGAQLIVAVDEPYYFDFARNPVWNLDMPGPASPAPGLPYFRGPEAVAEYLRGLDIRYLAFTRSAASRFMYRRDTSLEQALGLDYWKLGAAYMLDFSSSLTTLSQSRTIVFEEAGLVVLDLAERAPDYVAPPADAEALAREGDRSLALKAALAERGGGAAWDVALNEDVRLVEGWCPAEVRWREGARVGMHQWMGERANIRLRSHGARPMKLSIAGVVPPLLTTARSSFALELRGEAFDTFATMTSEVAHSVVVPAERLRDVAWLDVTLVAGRWQIDPAAPCGGRGFAIQDITWVEAVPGDGDAPADAPP